MKIGGVTKLTLLDFPSVVACTVFTSGCNFRCPFCHNASLVCGEQLPNSEEKTTLEFLEKRKNVLEGLCLSGGEPLLQKDVENFLRNVKALGYKIKLDTNGSFPEKLISLVNENLIDYVAMDVKNSKRLYAATAGANVDINAICKSVEFLETGVVDYEFRTTVTGNLHTEQSIEEMGQWLVGAKRLFLQKFEDSGNLVGSCYGCVPTAFVCDDEVMLRYRDILKRFVPQTYVRGVDVYTN